MAHYLIIGNGTSGNCAAEVLREGDEDSRITIISSEPNHYLYRHRLAGFLVDQQGIESLSVHSPEWYEQKRIQLRLNQAVVQVNPKEKWVLLAHRERIRYDKLLICSGARHRIPEYLSHFEALLTRFSSGPDAIRLKGRIEGVRHVTMLGGDCIGLQVAHALIPRGVKVTMVMDDYRFWPLEFDDKVKDRLAAALAEKGVKVIGGDHVTDLERANGGLKVKTMNGEDFDTDLALVCSGMVPCLEFLRDSGIDVERGVLVSEHLLTSVPDVWAAGECAQVYHDRIRDYRCSTGYANAALQGRVAALNMLGSSESAPLCEEGTVVISGEKFTTYGWKGFSLDEED